MYPNQGHYGFPQQPAVPMQAAEGPMRQQKREQLQAMYRQSQAEDLGTGWFANTANGSDKRVKLSADDGALFHSRPAAGQDGAH